MADLMTLEDVRDWHRGCEQAANADGHTNAASAHKELADAIDAAIKQREQEAKDAARYRWLRDMRNREQATMLVSFKMNLDVAIDAAMAQESGNE